MAKRERITIWFEIKPIGNGWLLKDEDSHDDPIFYKTENEALEVVLEKVRNML